MGYFAAMALLKNLQEVYSKPDCSDASDLTFEDLEQLVEGDDSRQPVLLTVAQDSPNDPQCLMTVDGAEVSAEEVTRLERVCVLFDGNDETALSTARGQWKALTEAGCAAQYWSEESGRWEKKQECPERT